MAKIFPIARENAACDYHRIILPFQFLNTEIAKAPDEADIIIFNRLPNLTPTEFIKEKKLKGFKYIIDLDDFWFVPQNHYLYKAFSRIHYGENIIELIKNADAVTVTTEVLYLKAKEYNENIHIIPNSLPFDKLQFLQSKKIDSNLNFVYAGGISHQYDVKLIGSKSKKIDANFYCAGIIKNNKQSEAILENLNFKNIGIIENKTLDCYMDVYNNMDVSLIPLEKNLFNICKSNLKVLEAGCKGLMAIASKVLPYYNEKDAKYINYIDSNINWYNIIKHCQKNPNYVKDRAALLSEYVRKEYDLSKANQYRKELYESV